MKINGKVLFIPVMVLAALACATLQVPATIAPTVVSSTATLLPQATNTPLGPQSISISNFHSLAQLRQWNVESDILNMYGIALSPHADQVALITLRYPEQYSLELRNSQDGTLVWKENLGEKAAYPAVAFSPDGSLIAVGLDHGNVIIYNASDGSLKETLTGNLYSVRMVAFSPDGTLIASGSSDNTARVWQVANGMSMSVQSVVTDVRDISFSPDSKHLAVTTNYINVYNATSQSNVHTVFYDTKGDTQNMGQVAFSPNGLFLIGEGNWYNTGNNHWRPRILVWDYPYNITSPVEIPLTDNVEDLVVSPDGQLILCDYADKGQLLAINIVKREIVGTVDLGPKLYMAYSQDMSTFAIISSKTSVNIWGISP